MTAITMKGNWVGQPNAVYYGESFRWRRGMGWIRTGLMFNFTLEMENISWTY